jgi:hypothetical protein
MAGLAIDPNVGVVEDVTGGVVIKAQVLRAISLRLCKGAPPLTEQESGGSKYNEEKSG